MTMTTVPAQPGFHLVILAKPPGTYEFHYYPIIAWIIDIETDKANYLLRIDNISGLL
jgi:hypothetical protein